MRFKPLDNLTEDEVLAENLVNLNNQILLKKNATLNDKTTQRIKNMGFKSLYIKNAEEEAYLEEEVKDIINPEIRKRAISDVKDCMDTFYQELNKQKQQLVYGDSGRELISSIDRVSESLIDEILNSTDLTISIMDIKTDSHYQYEHAINTAVLSIMLSVKMGLTMVDMKNVAIASLLANIGYKDLPKEIFESDDPLTLEHWKLIKEHPKIGYDILTNNTNLNAHIKTIVLQHHERIDGSGYPNGLKENEIHPLAKVLMLTDVYDAMTSDRPYRNAYPHNEALEYIMGNAGRLFDFNLANAFSRCIIPYPAGTHVLLSNNQKAVVLKNNRSYPLRPVIRLFKYGKIDTSDAGYINMFETQNLTITKIIYE